MISGSGPFAGLFVIGGHSLANPVAICCGDSDQRAPGRQVPAQLISEVALTRYAQPDDPCQTWRGRVVDAALRHSLFGSAIISLDPPDGAADFHIAPPIATIDANPEFIDRMPK